MRSRLAVESRLMALGRAHDLLLQANWTSAKLSDVIEAAIEPFDGREVRRFSVQVNEGRIVIASSVDDWAQRIKLIWTESGGPPVREPTRHSFGTRLINRLAEQLHGEVRMKYQPAGLVCDIDMPLAALLVQHGH